MKLSSLILILTLLIWGCASKVEDEHPSGLNITEVKPNKWTYLMKQNMLHLAQVYDLSPFLYTKKINVESKVIPHSHPVLTLNTRHAENPKKILAMWMHEELHWWMDKNPKATASAVKELKKIYPDAPKGMGATADSTFLHLLVCYLEMRTLALYVGEKESKVIIEDIMRKDKIYPWVYYQVLYKNFAIKKILKKHKLVPVPLTA
jgi:hypothetical protein